MEENEEVLSEEFVGPPKRKVVVRIIVPGHGGSVVERMMELLDRQIEEERIPLGADIVLTITREEDRLGGIGIIEGGGVFGHFPAERRPVVSDGLEIFDRRALSSAIAKFAQRSVSFLGVIEPFLAMKEGKKNWPVERYGRLVRKGASILRQTQREKRGKKSRRG